MSAIGKGSSGACEQDCVTDCEGLIDDDGDLFPGVTTYVCGYSEADSSKNKCQAESPSTAGTTVQGKLFFNFRIEPTFNGTAKSSCEVAGHVASDVRYEVVGADVAVANTAVSVSAAKKSLPFFDVTTDQSRFRMIRVDGKHNGPNWKLPALSDPKSVCSAVLGHLNELN
jgi:hypothetical protein